MDDAEPLDEHQGDRGGSREILCNPLKLKEYVYSDYVRPERRCASSDSARDVHLLQGDEVRYKGAEPQCLVIYNRLN